MLKRKTLTLIITALTVLALVAGIFGLNALSAKADGDGQVAVEFEYKDDTHKEITGVTVPDGAENVHVTIPEGVTAIGENAFEDTAITGVTLNEGLVTIGDYAFTGTGVTSVRIPKTVIRIGEHAFENCTALSEITFDERAVLLEIAVFAFKGCTALSALSLPDNALVRQFAFDGCNSLRWVYVGNNSRFHNSAGDVLPDAAFFPLNTSVTIVFPSKKAYNDMLNQEESTFKDKHGSHAQYLVNVNCYIGDSEQPVVYERMNGHSFNYVPNKATGVWNEDTAYRSLPVQDETYSKTTWYSDEQLKNAVSYEDVNALLATESEINLYCHDTIAVPVIPSDPVSWVYKSDVVYDINDAAQVLKALGCEQEFTAEQLAAFEITVLFADEKGNPADTPEEISGNGVYSITVSLKSEYGVWQQPVSSSITISVNTGGFTIVMIVLLVIGVLAVLITVSTAVIRKKVQAKNKKKQLTQQEVLEKFKAAGGETTLK